MTRPKDKDPTGALREGRRVLKLAHEERSRREAQPQLEIRHSTGVRALDAVLGEGRGGTVGYPQGRVVELFGPERAGKRTLALYAIAACQRAGGVAAYLDASHSLDISYAKACGVDPAKLLVSQPDALIQCLDIFQMLVRSGVVDLVVVDDVAALCPTPDTSEVYYVDPMPRLLATALRELTSIAHRTGTTPLFLTKLRPRAEAAALDTGTGGNALKYYASIRLDVRMLWRLGEASAPGQLTGVKVVKNKLAPPFKRCEVEILDGTGIIERDAEVAP